MSLADRLVSSYSTLDSALVLSIISDFEEDQEAEARQILDALAAESSSTIPSTSTSGHAEVAPSLSYSEETASNSGATTSTDEEEAERLFREWSLQDAGTPEQEEQQLKEDATNGSAYVTERSRELENAATPLSFLKNLFPKRDQLELTLTLDDAQGDVAVAIETLLTEDFLLQEEADELAHYSEQEVGTSSGKGRKKTKQRKHKPGKEVISLTSTPRGIKSLVDSGYESDSKHSPREVTNRWVQLDSTVLYLSTLLSIPPGHLTSLFHRNNSSLPLAIASILDEREHLFESLENGQQSLSELAGLYPDRPIGTLKRCLAGTSGDLDKSVDLVNTLQDLHAKDGTPLAHRLLLDATERQSTRSALLQKPTIPVPPIRSGNGNTTISNGRIAEPATERPPNAYECASLAQMIRAKQDDARRSAARAFQSRHAMGSAGVAAYWSEHARSLAKQADTWELRAARAVVNERRSNMPVTHRAQVDLHGLTASQALTVSSECLTAWWAAPTASPTFTIITGAGRHSSGQTPILLPAIRKLLEREGYDWKYEDKYSRAGFIISGLQGRRKTGAY